MTNIRFIAKSRKVQRPGDVFVMLLPNERYLFGRVIATDAQLFAMTKVVLVYIFKTQQVGKQLSDRDELQTDRLLIPPVFTNRLGWSRGFFETIDNLPFLDGERLEQHSFLHPLHDRHYDEYSKPVSNPVEPIGMFAVGNYRTIDEHISDALGFEPAP